MAYYKKVAGAYLAVIAADFAIMFTASSVGFRNGRFLFCLSGFLLSSLGPAYEYSRRHDLLEYLVALHKNDARAKQYYGLQLGFWRVEAIVATIFLVLACYFLIRYGAHS